jgi:ankyrin repeat protein
MAKATEFFEAVKQGAAERVAALLADNPALAHATEAHAKTGLHWAAQLDHVDVARVLLDNGADMETLTSWGATALDWAATMGSQRVAELLLARGAHGYTLITAAALGKSSDVRVILESGDNLAAHGRQHREDGPNDEWPADSALMTGDVLSHALYAAARNGHNTVVEYLLDRGANVDAKGFFGATGLHWAAINGHDATVNLLMSRGADPSIRDARFGATPESWALEGEHLAIAAALRQRPS